MLSVLDLARSHVHPGTCIIMAETVSCCFFYFVLFYELLCHIVTPQSLPSYVLKDDMIFTVHFEIHDTYLRALELYHVVSA